MMKVVIADDHLVFAEGLERILKEDSNGIEVAGVASNDIELFELLVSGQIEVVILDISMPGMEEAAALRRIKEKYPAVKVLMLTMHDDEPTITRMLQHGADGYVLKNLSGREVLDALQTIHAGQKYFSAAVQRIVFDAATTAPSRGLERASARIHITKTEERVLGYLRKDLVYKEIADQLNVSVSTVETHTRNLKAKVGANTRAGLIDFAIKHGYEISEN